MRLKSGERNAKNTSMSLNNIANTRPNMKNIRWKSKAPKNRSSPYLSNFATPNLPAEPNMLPTRHNTLRGATPTKSSTRSTMRMLLGNFSKSTLRMVNFRKRSSLASQKRWLKHLMGKVLIWWSRRRNCSCFLISWMRIGRALLSGKKCGLWWISGIWRTLGAGRRSATRLSRRLWYTMTMSEANRYLMGWACRLILMWSEPYSTPRLTGLETSNRKTSPDSPTKSSWRRPEKKSTSRMRVQQRHLLRCSKRWMMMEMVS